MPTFRHWLLATLGGGMACVSMASPAFAYCWTNGAPGIVDQLQREVERDPASALRRADLELARLQDGKLDPALGGWMYAIKAAASYQLNGSDAVAAAATKGLQLIGNRPGGPARDLQLALLNSAVTPEMMQRSIAQFDAAEHATTNSAGRICIMIFRGLNRADLLQVQDAVVDLTTAYVQSKADPMLHAYSAAALASALSRRDLSDVLTPLLDEAMAEYKREGLIYDVLTTYVRIGLALSFDGQALAARRNFESLLRDPHVHLISDDILAIVHGHICRSYLATNELDRAEQACQAAERLLPETRGPSWRLIYASRADLALRRGKPRETLALLDKAEQWTLATPAPQEFDLRARAFAALGEPAKAIALFKRYVAAMQDQDRADRQFLANAWRARVIALQKEGERLQLQQNLAIAQERGQAQRKLITLISLASLAIIALLLVILLISRRARAQTLRLTNEIQQQARDKIRMIAHISHEIRSPLGSMTLLARALQTTSPTSPDAKQLIARLDQSGERIARLLTDMMDYYRLEVSQLALQPTEVVLAQLLDDVLAAHRGHAAQKGIDLAVSIAAETPQTIFTDSQRLFQILDNLVANAIRFTDHGSVTLHADWKATVQRIELRVEDTGIGIPPEQLKRLFLDFQQGHSDEHRRGGNGLGLAISRAIAAALGGELSLSSHPTGGVTATVLLPARYVPRVTAVPSQPRQRQNGQKREPVHAAGNGPEATLAQQGLDQDNAEPATLST